MLYTLQSLLEQNVRLLDTKLVETRKAFKSLEDIDNHIDFIKKEIAISNKDKTMMELRNWLNFIN